MKDELPVVLLITVPEPLKELPDQDSILLQNPSRVQFHFLASLRIRKLPLLVLGGQFTLECEDFITRGDDLDLVVDIKHGLLPSL